MVKNFKYGFDYNSIKYGWLNKELYKLPQEINMRGYSLKKITLINVGNKKGYRVATDRKTIDQLMEITEIIDFRYVINGNKSKDCPF